jgi:hypothetical protein
MHCLPDEAPTSVDQARRSGSSMLEVLLVQRPFRKLD